MERLSKKLDSGTYAKLTGFQCHVEQCGLLIKGYIDDLKHHLVTVHGMVTTIQAEFPFKCSICGSMYAYFSSFRVHALKEHPLSNFETEPNEPVSEEPIQIGSEPLELDIKNPHFYSNPVTLQQTMSNMAELITGLRCDVSLPEKKMEKFMEGYLSVSNWIQQYTLSKVKSFLESKNLLADSDSIQLINELEVPDLTSNVKTPELNFAYLCRKAGRAIPEPTEVLLGKYKQIRRVLTTRSRGRKFQQKFRKSEYINKVSTRKDVLHYISIVDTLELIMSNPKARTMVDNEESESAESIESFRDGELFQRHPFLQLHANCLRISLHIDEGEYGNPLGSRKGKNKMTNICFKIENLDPKINSSLDRIYLALMVKSSVLKRYGYEKILQPLIDDLLRLESLEGVQIKTDSGVWIMRAVLVHVLGDTLALHDIYGMLGPSANMFCRICEISRKDLISGELGNTFPTRTADSVQNALVADRMSQNPSSLYGIRTFCSLHQLKFYRWPTNQTLDPMHDLLEGVVPMVLKKILQIAVYRSKTLTEQDINMMIESFDYGDAEVRDKPSASFTRISLKSKSHGISQSAAQCWLLLRSFPFLFHKILLSNNMHQEIISTLLKITYISFSYKLKLEMINELSESILKFHQLFKRCFPSTNAINKIHHIAHYPQVIRENGPIAHFSCMMYESKFKESKSQSKTCGNFKNLSYSLTRRLNLKQVNSILNHKYITDLPNIISSSIIQKKLLDTAPLLFDLHTNIKTIRRLEINGVMFCPGHVVKFEKCSAECYGILLATIEQDFEILFLIQELNIIQFDSQLFACYLQILLELCTKNY